VIEKTRELGRISRRCWRGAGVGWFRAGGIATFWCGADGWTGLAWGKKRSSFRAEAAGDGRLSFR